MQFLHLFSFVVVASYAAALPQPAELSEKYSSNVDANLASGLEARSYQPESNSYKESATLVSLKRRGNSGSNPSPSFPPVPKRKFGIPFTDNDVSSENLAFIIGKVQDGALTLLGNEREIGQKFGGDVEWLVTVHLGKATYVNAALNRWVKNSLDSTLDVIKSGLDDKKDPGIRPYLAEHIKKREDKVNLGSKILLDTTSDILKGIGSDIINFEDIHGSTDLILNSNGSLISRLAHLLRGYGDSKILQDHLLDIDASVRKFREEQQKSYEEIMEKLEAASSQVILPTDPDLK